MARLLSAGIVPNFFTMANMFSGYFSVLLAANERLTHAAWFIVAAAILDTLDGKLARMTKSSSNFGVQYDSLADVISFGLAPSFLIFKAFFFQWGNIGLLISFIPLVFGSIRLARFNIRLKGFEKAHFEGLPIPAAAVTLATFIIFNFYFWQTLRWSKVFLFLTLAVSILMVTTIRYETMPRLTLRGGRGQKIKILVLVTGLILLIVFPQAAFFPLAITYIFSGPLYLLYRILILEEDDDTNLEEAEESKT